MSAACIKKPCLPCNICLQYEMEARRSKRTIISLPAEIISKDSRHAASIENLSDEGIYLVTAPANPSPDLTPATIIELRFRFHSGEKMCLHCRVKWSYPTPPHGYTNSIGLEIMDPPLTYIESLKAQP